jgi:hypothetical protein
MLIKKTSPLSGVVNEIEIDVTQAQLDDFASGTFIQVAMPNLSPAEREFILSGIPAQEWDELWKEE